MIVIRLLGRTSNLVPSANRISVVAFLSVRTKSSFRRLTASVASMHSNVPALLNCTLPLMEVRRTASSTVLTGVAGLRWLHPTNSPVDTAATASAAPKRNTQL